MKPVTLVITDLDGTLLDSEKKVGEETKEAIRNLKNHGILFGIASGRPVESGLILAKNWGIEDSISFLVGMNGGAMYDTRLKRKYEFADMDGDMLLDIVNHFKKEEGKKYGKIHFEVMSGNNRYVEWSSPETLANAELYGENEIIKDLQEYMKGRRFDKLIIRTAAEDQKALAEYAKEYKNPHVTSFPTSEVLYEYVNPEINKGYGLHRVCDHYGLNLENVVAFGDEANDVEMLMNAGTGVAMKNATLPARMAADVISDFTNDEQAEAKYINEVIIPNAEGKLE